MSTTKSCSIIFFLLLLHIFFQFFFFFIILHFFDKCYRKFYSNNAGCCKNFVYKTFSFKKDFEEMFNTVFEDISKINYQYNFCSIQFFSIKYVANICFSICLSLVGNNWVVIRTLSTRAKGSFWSESCQQGNIIVNRWTWLFGKKLFKLFNCTNNLEYKN